jgi:hypothetical protein
MELQLIGDRVDMLYMLRGQPSVYDSTLDEEHEEAPETTVGPRNQSCILREESESLLRTGRNISWCGRTNAHDGVDSPRSLRFLVAFRKRYSSSSYVLVLRMALGSKGAPTEHSVMGPDDGDDSEYIPC